MVFELGFALVGQFPGVISGGVGGNGVLFGEQDGGDGGCRIMDDCHGEVFRGEADGVGLCCVDAGHLRPPSWAGWTQARGRISWRG